MESAPFFADIAEGPSGGGAYWARARDGVRVRLGLWPGKKGGGGVGTVLLFPGRTEYIEKYGPVAADLAGAGYATLAIDWRGQGLSDRICKNRMVGHVADFSEFQLDIAAMLEAVSALDLPQPLYLLSHSMGGCIALRALHQGLSVKAAAFSAPMWGISMAPASRPVAWASAWVSHFTVMGCNLAPGTGIKTAVLASPFEGNTLTTDRDMYTFMQVQARARPDLTLGGPSMSWLYAALMEARALARMPAPGIPAITHLGSNERIVEAAPVHAIMAGWSSGALKIVVGAEHEVLMERKQVRAEFNDDMFGLFAAHR